MLGAGSTTPDVDLDQILASLDGDTRSYLLLLLSGGAGAFHDPASTVPALQGTFKRFAPLDRDTRTFATLLSARSRNLSLAIHNLQRVATALGGVDGQLASLIDSSNTNFAAISSQDANLEAGLTLLPGTLAQTNQTLGKVQGFAAQLGPTLTELLPFARALAPALTASRPLFHDTTPVIRDQLRPFSIAVQPLAKALKPAATELSKAVPPLTSSVAVINKLFNTLAYQPRGQRAGIPVLGLVAGPHRRQPDRPPGRAGTDGAAGIFMATCPALNLLETIDPGEHSVDRAAARSPERARPRADQLARTARRSARQRASGAPR